MIQNADHATQLYRLEMIVCVECLRGEEGTCHTPGCVYWMHDAPGRLLWTLVRTFREPSPVERRSEGENRARIDDCSDLGDRLRSVRRQQHLSLQAVEERSNREFKASVLGAYERGERVISVLRLQRLAAFYGVPVSRLLSTSEVSAGGGQPGGEASSDQPARGPIRMDLSRLDQLQAPEQELLRRYVWMIQLQREDFNGRVITLRDEDVIALGRIFGRDEASMRDRIDQLGLRMEL